MRNDVIFIGSIQNFTKIQKLAKSLSSGTEIYVYQKSTEGLPGRLCHPLGAGPTRWHPFSQHTFANVWLSFLLLITGFYNICALCVFFNVSYLLKLEWRLFVYYFPVFFFVVVLWRLISIIRYQSRKKDPRISPAKRVTKYHTSVPPAASACPCVVRSPQTRDWDSVSAWHWLFIYPLPFSGRSKFPFLFFQYFS